MAIKYSTMTPLFKKLNFKGQTPVGVWQAPDSFREEMEAMKGETHFITTFNESAKLPFAIAFTTRQEELNLLSKIMDEHTEGDAIIWIAYPKGSSKRYPCDFNRDTGWEAWGAAGFEPVRQVAIDEDWSALRFRRVAYIQKMTRSFAISDEGKRKTGKI